MPEIKAFPHGEVLGQGRQAGATVKRKEATHGEVLGQGRQAGATVKKRLPLTERYSGRAVRPVQP